MASFGVDAATVPFLILAFMNMKKSCGIPINCQVSQFITIFPVTTTLWSHVESNILSSKPNMDWNKCFNFFLSISFLSS